MNNQVVGDFTTQRLVSLLLLQMLLESMETPRFIWPLTRISLSISTNAQCQLSEPICGEWGLVSMEILGSSFSFFTGALIKAVLEKKAIPDPSEWDDVPSIFV